MNTRLLALGNNLKVQFSYLQITLTVDILMYENKFL